jgi:peptidoglycan-N-acetylglucosamine deacetylase
MRASRFFALLGLSLLPDSVEAAPPVLDFSAITRDEQHSGDCAITFDDGPGDHTPILLDLLKTKHVPATFFVLGKQVLRHPEMIQRMVHEGHEVDNHSYDHPDMRKLDDAARQKEIDDTEHLLTSLGATPHFFRPPYGAYNPQLVQEAQHDGLEVVLWSHDSQDWRYHTVKDLENNILPALKDKKAHGVFLFHDIHDSTITAMPDVIDALTSAGCHFVTVGQWNGDNAAPANDR